MHFTKTNMAPVFALIEECRDVPQSHIHHPEGDVFTHTLQVMSLAFRETIDTDLILAAMLHDVGKICCRKGHEQFSGILIKNYVSQKTLSLVENHMRVWTYILGEMNKLSKCQWMADHPYLPELIQLARWDKKGRKKGWVPNYDPQDIIYRLNMAWNDRFGPF